jgi:hypothetical protein
MTDDMKRKLNSGVVEFVNRESDRRRRVLYVTAEEIANTYVRSHLQLIRETSVTPDQLLRMVYYTLLIGYPQDAFLCCEFSDAIVESAARLAAAEFDPNVLAAGDPALDLCESDFLRMEEATQLCLEETTGLHDRQKRINELLRPFFVGITPKQNTAACARRLAEKYDDAIARHLPREHWMEEFEWLIVPVRLLEPGLSSFEAFMRALPKRIAVPIQGKTNGAPFVT